MTVRERAPEFRDSISRLSWKLRFLRAALQVLDHMSPRLSARVLAAQFRRPRRANDVSTYERSLPRGARRVEIAHRGSTLTGWTWGEAGPAMLLVHGWESHTGRMTPLIEPLLAQGFRVVAFDAPGHGLSPQAATDLIDVGRAIGHMVEQYGPFAGIIAHSFGAAATAIMLARHPELAPKKLVLISPMLDLEQQLAVFADAARLSAERKSRLRALIEGQIELPVARCSTLSAVRGLHLPGLVVHDRFDRLVPFSVGAAIAQAWVGAQLFTTEHLGHRRGLSSMTVICRILDFLGDERRTRYVEGRVSQPVQAVAAGPHAERSQPSRTALDQRVPFPA